MINETKHRRQRITVSREVRLKFIVRVVLKK
jgi:hypothetical protein